MRKRKDSGHKLQSSFRNNILSEQNSLNNTYRTTICVPYRILAIKQCVSLNILNISLYYMHTCISRYWMIIWHLQIDPNCMMWLLHTFFPSAYPDNMLFSIMSFISFAVSGTMLLANPSARLFPLSSAARQARILATALQLAGGFALRSPSLGPSLYQQSRRCLSGWKRRSQKKHWDWRMIHEECVEIVFIQFFRRHHKHQTSSLPLSEGGGALTSDLASSSLQYGACFCSQEWKLELPSCPKLKKTWRSGQKWAVASIVRMSLAYECTHNKSVFIRYMSNRLRLRQWGLSSSATDHCPWVP